jgi:ferredoxin-NADP reductase
MAIRISEILYWLQDVSQHVRVSRRRKSLQEPGKGYDHLGGSKPVGQVVARLHPTRMQLRAADIHQETPTSRTFQFEREDGPLPPFRPGQYVNLFVDVDGVLTSRPYSIASAPGSELLELTVKEKPGGFVSRYLLNELRVGDVLESSGPAGSFYYEPLSDGEELVFLAGGSGITPFMSILRDVVRREMPVNVQLIYGSRKSDDVIYGEMLQELAAEHPNLSYTLVISEPPPDYDGKTGFLDANLIQNQVGELSGKTFYICGPGEMYDFCLQELIALGVPPHKIKRELYGPPDDVTQEPGWPAEITSEAIFTVEVEGGKTIRAPAGEPLMNSLERYGISVLAECRVGACSICRVRLLSGEVFMPPHTGLRESDRQFGYIHTCVSYPLRDLRIRL